MQSLERWTYLYCIDAALARGGPRRRYNLLMLAAYVLSMSLAAPSQGQPVPQPFPRPGSPTVQAPSPRPAQPSPSPPAPAGTAAPLDNVAPTEAMLGVPIYPAAQFITSYDAGRDQR